jgi:pimeloyl-ACP methyl ester carboxylesterase
LAGIAVVTLGVGIVGCQSGNPTPRVVFLDGAGHFGAGYSVRTGLEQAGFVGSFETFSWSSWLGPGADHLVVARSKGKAQQLADRIADLRRDFPKGKIHLMGLSAGTALILSALEDLPKDTCVDSVFLFSPSVSASRNLAPALRHVSGRLYATCSPHDGILSAIAVNADGGSGPPAGIQGFALPTKLTREDLRQYVKVVNVPWRPSYTGFGWHGGHVQVTGRRFVQHVVAPRAFSEEPYPLDQPLVSPWVLADRIGGPPIGSGGARTAGFDHAQDATNTKTGAQDGRIAP